MAGKKTTEKKGDMVKVNLAEIDRKRMEYRWGMESFFRNHEIETGNYKEDLERYRKFCLVLMSEKDIEKIEKAKDINVKRIPYINLHKIRREKPLGRWMASACFKNCGINENRYKKELEAYNQACRLQMKPEEMAAIAEKLQCKVSEFSVSDRIVDLSEIRRRLEEAPLKDFFAEWGIDINKDAEKNGIQGCCFTANLKEVRRIEKELNCCKKEFLKSERLGEYTVDLSEVKQRIEENILKRFFEKYGMDTDEYTQAIAAYEKSGLIKAERADIDKMERHMQLQKESFIKNAVDLSDIQRRLKVHEPGDIEQNLKDCGIEIQNYEEELKTYKEASYLTMKEDDIEKLAKSLRCKKEKIEIKQNQVKLLQIEEKKEKITREKWSTLEGFFKSIGVKKNYQKEIEQYENKHFIECNKNLFDTLIESFNCGGEDLLFEDNKDGNKEIYKVKIVELERRKKTTDGEWRESLYDTLKVKKILDGANKEESDRIKEAIKKFAKASSINISQDDCEKISNSTNSEITEIIVGRVSVDRRNIPGLGIDNTDNPTKKSGVASGFKVENSGLSNKLKEAVETGTNCFEMNLSTANQIAQISGYKLEDLLASAVDVAKDEIKKKLLPFAPQIKVQILSDLCIPELDLLIQESEQRDRENSRIEYLKTDEGYDVTIYFNGEECTVDDIPKMNQEDDIEGYLIDWLCEYGDEGWPDELFDGLSTLPIVELEERKNYGSFFNEKFLQLLSRMDADGKTLDDKLRALRGEMPFTQDMCDNYEVPNPFNIEE